MFFRLTFIPFFSGDSFRLGPTKQKNSEHKTNKQTNNPPLTFQTYAAPQSHKGDCDGESPSADSQKHHPARCLAPWKCSAINDAKEQIFKGELAQRQDRAHQEDATACFQPRFLVTALISASLSAASSRLLAAASVRRAGRLTAVDVLTCKCFFFSYWF